MKNCIMAFSTVFILLPAVLFAAPPTKDVPKTRVLLLPFSISVGVPIGWRVFDSKEEQPFAASKALRLNALNFTLAQNGHLTIISSPLSGPGEASAEISVKPTQVSQQTVAAMSSYAMITAEWQFRQDIEKSARTDGVKIIEWHNMTRETVGNVVALVMHYKYQMLDRKPLNMDSYRFELGSKSVKLRLQYTDESASALKASLNQVKNAFRIEKTNQ